MTKQHFVSLGPAIPVVPVGDFAKFRLTEEQWADAWRVIGPSVERNMSGGRHGPLPLWKIICAAYLEGLHHGSEINSAERD